MIARIVTAIAAVAALVAAVAVPPLLNEQAPDGPPTTTVTVTPARLDVACPGPLALPAGDIESADPDLDPSSDDVDRATYTTGSTDEAGPAITSDAMVAGQVERVGSGDIAGIAALTCTAPTHDQWLVGGSTSIGNSARLVLTNPSRASVEATVELYGRLGKVEGRRVVAIAPHDQQSVLLEGFAVELPSIVAHVTATGAGVVAAIQDSRLDGFTPQGTDWAVAGSDPATHVVIPGLGVANESSTATVRLMSPEGTTANLTLLGPDGAQAWDGVSALRLDPGVVVEVPVPASAVAAVEVRAAAPVVAAGIITTTRASDNDAQAGTAADFAWIPGQAVSEAERAIVAVGYDQAIEVVAPTGGTFRAVDASGRVVAQAQIGPGAAYSAPIDLDPGAVVSVEGDFVWALVTRTDEGFLTALSPTRVTVDPVDVDVLTRRYIP